MFPALSVSKSVSAYSPSSSSKLKITSVVVALAVTSDNAITKIGAAFLMRISAFIAFFFPSPPELIFEIAGPEEAKNLAVDSPPPDSDPLWRRPACRKFGLLVNTIRFSFLSH
jgi:hypothetical protein